ncbi:MULTISPECIES: flagellar hook assembly protein FlgD [Pseudomonas]|jgi:flagellar basal-body rod modification protein FlgD|uniref:Basal-body rod modification protein FlgD n=1 Tax=Pseudomonas extremaustralis TaxID=359110 RepID=A0A5C5Q596_9PSED|nr:flagellar hook assembly protein FlgD [Pseudomonas extremaustralis]EZI24824.1 flagellar basal body rod modification protein [Pseudomonas extremaustralis 14-3 substr. 14-3b]MDF3134047.1 flagellar hook assembly protein FlgD [Pseudomonas extremaustralis]TWS00897.1 flagellar hook assembly protein FlgD [Pseudomonas extremaustralis]SDG37514.1 flagellar basal-body rod modification protein FlgD [Pseudomonas extremaustralis]
MTSTISSSVLSTMNSTSTTAESSTSASDELQDQFLTLLTTELQNQDPTDPMDNSEMVTQLAQISTISSIEDVTSTLEGISGQISASETLQASALVGNGVLIDGNTIQVDDGVTTPFGVTLDSDADSVTVTIKDSSGTVVRTLDEGEMSAGTQSLSWDGLQDDGTTAADGAYTFSISATTDDVAVASTALKYALVTGVTTDSSNAVALDLGGVNENVALSDISLVL